MRNHDMMRRERHRNSLDHSHQRIVVGDEDLEIITGLRQLRRRSDKVGHRSRSPVPNEDRQPLMAQMIGDATANNAEANNSNALSNSTGHVRSLWKLRLNLRPCNSIHSTTNRARRASSDSRVAMALRRFSAPISEVISGRASASVSGRAECRSVTWSA